MSTYRVPQVLTALRPAAQEQWAGPYSPGVWQAARCGSSVNCPLSFLPESCVPALPGLLGLATRVAERRSPHTVVPGCSLGRAGSSSGRTLPGTAAHGGFEWYRVVSGLACQSARLFDVGSTFGFGRCCTKGNRYE